MTSPDPAVATLTGLLDITFREGTNGYAALKAIGAQAGVELAAIGVREALVERMAEAAWEADRDEYPEQRTWDELRADSASRLGYLKRSRASLAALRGDS